MSQGQPRSKNTHPSQKGPLAGLGGNSSGDWKRRLSAAPERAERQLSLGVLATSGKENEFRLPIHPAHFERVDADLRARMLLEEGYGEKYGVSDEHLAALVAGVASRAEIIAAADVVLLPKPTRADMEALRYGQVLWGWPHAVQDETLTQISIDKRLSVIAWEVMNHWAPNGEFASHVFYENNEMAGYCSVMHAMSLTGVTGAYGRALTAAVIGSGCTARDAVKALASLGVPDITVLTTGEAQAFTSPTSSVTTYHLRRNESDPSRSTAATKDGQVPTAGLLAGADIVVNCVLQDTDAPLMFVTNKELAAFAPGSLIVDVSCDASMGFEFAHPTSFTDPMFTVGDGVAYYGVDHSVSRYLH